MTTTTLRRRLAPAVLAAALLTAPSAPLSPPASAAPSRLVITEGGTAGHPAVYRGQGRTVDGTTVEADHVIVEGYTIDTPEARGIEITGNDITVRNNYCETLKASQTLMFDESSRPGCEGPEPGGAP